MGKQTLYLKPNRDISLEHAVFPSYISEYGYQLINEEKNDGPSTYIYTTDKKSVVENYSNFGIALTGSTSDHTKIKKVVKAYVRVCGWSTSSHKGFTALLLYDTTGNQKYFRYWPYSTNYSIDQQGKVEEDTTIAALINELIDKGSLDELSQWRLMINTRVEDDGGNDKSQNSYVSQAVFELECEYGDNLDIYDKVNGSYKPAQVAYHKVNGIWTEISEDEAKSILNNNTIRRG